MLNKLLQWVAGKEPVAAATGLAAVVTALAGVLTAFDVVELTAEQIAAVGALAAAVAGWAGRSKVTPVARAQPSEGGGVPLAVIIFVATLVLLVIGFGLCGDALFEDEDEVDDLGMPALVLDHDCYEYGDCGGGQNYEDQWSNEDRNRNRNRNRGAFSPGPFDDSPVDAFNGNVICLPGSTCYSDDRRDQPPPEEGQP